MNNATEKLGKKKDVLRNRVKNSKATDKLRTNKEKLENNERNYKATDIYQEERNNVLESMYENLKRQRNQAKRKKLSETM